MKEKQDSSYYKSYIDLLAVITLKPSEVYILTLMCLLSLPLPPH